MGTPRRVWFERTPTDELRPFVPADFTILTPTRNDDAFDGIEAAEGIVASAEFYSPDVLDRAANAQVIARTGIGYDRVDVAAATARGIAVCNAPDGPTVSTAEHSVALLLAAAKSVGPASAALRSGERYRYEDHRAVELAGKTLGLVGCGRIARRVAAAAQGLDMVVAAYDPYVADLPDHISRRHDLEGLLRDADVVSVHVPLTDKTRNLFDAAAFATMRPGSILVNAARGEVIDQDALIEALDRGHVFAAGLDVTSPEPLPVEHPLLDHPRVVVTPHIASSTPESRIRIFKTALDQVASALSGNRPAHIVNPEAWTHLQTTGGAPR